MKKEIVRRHIVFSGWVQGVGFRYRACRAAELYDCTGWVKNEWDDTVSMEIQGEEKAIEKVLQSIMRGTYVQVENMESRLIEPLENERGFRAY